MEQNNIDPAIRRLFFRAHHRDQEKELLEVTETAAESLKNYVREYEMDSPIRITIMQQGGCSGMSLGMVFDSATEKDRSFSVAGLQFIVEEDLFSTCGAIKVDFIDSSRRKGFAITSAIPLDNGSCGSCTGECGRESS